MNFLKPKIYGLTFVKAESIFRYVKTVEGKVAYVKKSFPKASDEFMKCVTSLAKSVVAVNCNNYFVDQYLTRIVTACFILVAEKFGKDVSKVERPKYKKNKVDTIIADIKTRRFSPDGCEIVS